MVRTPEVVEYQVRQTTMGIDVAVVASAGSEDELDLDDLAARLVAGLVAAGLTDARVHVKVVGAAEIERHPLTGKTRRFITSETTDARPAPRPGPQ